jgi:hypothetical protein
MKALAAFCVCGYFTRDLDDLDAHTAHCVGGRCPSRWCHAGPGEACITATGKPLPLSRQHAGRRRAA